MKRNDCLTAKLMLAGLLGLGGCLATAQNAWAEEGGGGGDRQKLMQAYQNAVKNGGGGSTGGAQGGQGKTAGSQLDPNGNISKAAQDQASMKNLQDLLKKAQQALKDQQYLSASKLAGLIVSVEGKGTEGLHDSALNILIELEKKAQTIFDTAEEAFIKKEFDTAVDNYALITAQFPNSLVFPKARGRMMEIRSMPALASKAAFAEAQKTDEGEDYLTAIAMYENVIEKYPESVAAIKAKKAITAIKADPAKKAKLEAKAGALSEADLKTRYALACNYTNAQPKDEAEQKTFAKGMEIFQDIVDNYPASELAPKAKEKLDTLASAALKNKPATTNAAK